MERPRRQPVAFSRNSTAGPICAALDGDSRRCQYAYLQSSTIDDARLHSMTDRYFTGARRRKFWTFQNFRTATDAIGAQWRLVAFAHGCVCALWRSTAFIHGFGTAAERRQKPPMCNSGFSRRGASEGHINCMYTYIFRLNIILIGSSLIWKNIEIHIADTIMSWPNPKQWVIVHTSDFIMIIRLK